MNTNAPSKASSSPSEEMERQHSHTNDEQKVNERARHPVYEKSNHPKNNQNRRDGKQYDVWSHSGESLNAADSRRSQALNRAKQSSTRTY
jgi:hypothetical protein